MKIRVTFAPLEIEVTESTLDEYLLENYSAGEVAAASPEVKVAMLFDMGAEGFIDNHCEWPEHSLLELVK